MKPTAQIFLSYASADRVAVRDLYRRLSDAGFTPWMDEEDLLPGQSWTREIFKAIRNSELILVCLSATSLNKLGYVQKEITYALDIWQEKLADDIFVIPVRLEECEVPRDLRNFQ